MAGEEQAVGRGGLCGKCGAALPRRAKSKEKKPLRIMGLDTMATIRIYECRVCGERKAKIDATY